MDKYLAPLSKIKIDLPKYVLPVISNYNRLEGYPRSAQLDDNVKMEIRDPLWTLCRQWQFGEFQGEDAGSPWQANILGVHTQPQSFVYGSGDSIPFDVNIPLETVVEQEKIAPDLFLRTQMGRHFFKILKQKSIGKYLDLLVEHYPIVNEMKDDDDEGRYFYKGIEGTYPDGYRIHQEVSDGSFQLFIQNNSVVEASDHSVFIEAGQSFLDWFRHLYQQPEGGQSAWVHEHLEYSFSLESRYKNNNRRLIADQYASGHLDWKDFDQEVITDGATTDDHPAGTEQVQTFIPTPLTFGGMPHHRLWQLEDATTNFGKIDASPTALLNLLLAEYGLTYSNDWFILPYELDINTICQVKGIVVTDVFGQNSYVSPATQDTETNWQQFAVFHQTERDNATRNESLFYMTPSVGRLLEGDDLEKVNFIRDEMSNMVWAIEQIVPSEAGTGRILKRTVPSLKEFQPRDEESKIRYVLGNNVPDNWIPFIPVHKEVSVSEVLQEIRLQRARMPQGSRPLSAIVSEKIPVFFIEEEEVPRAGVIITRNFQRTRWLNGKTFLWIGRRKKAGRGEGLANLMFDQILSIERK